MSLDLWKVDWTNLNFPEPFGGDEEAFLERCPQDDNGNYLLDDDTLQQVVADSQKDGEVVPQKLVDFLKEQLKIEGYLMVAVG